MDQTGARHAGGKIHDRLRLTASVSEISTDLDKITMITAYVEFLVFKCHMLGNISISTDQHGGEEFVKGHNMKLQEICGIRKTLPLNTPLQIY